MPPSAEFVARVSGIPTMAKLPYQETADGLDAAFVGVPIDTGTSNRPGARWLQGLDLLLLLTVSLVRAVRQKSEVILVQSAAKCYNPIGDRYGDGILDYISIFMLATVR